MTATAKPARCLRLKRPIVFFDLETTGTDIAEDRIVEIAALRVNPDGTEKVFHTRVKPVIRIPDSAIGVHGISNADVRRKPTFLQIAKDLARHLKGCDLAGFNLKRFDVPMLQAEFKRAKMIWPKHDVCLIDCQVVFHCKEPRNLAAALKFYCGSEHDDVHSALADARATRAVLEAQIQRYSDLPSDVEGLDNFCEEARPSKFSDSGCWFLLKERDLIFAKGKHRGKPLAEVAETHPDYLEWMLSEDFPEDTKELIGKALDDPF
jgi:DNA polymerase-3 subunit epsilon